MILYDFLKEPIDKLYFNNPRRVLVGLRNTIIDILFYQREYSVYDLYKIQLNFKSIKDEFNDIYPTLTKQYFHDTSEWFDKSYNYYYYKIDDFPVLFDILKTIKCVDLSTGVFAVIDGPLELVPHKGEVNTYLRYHLTIQSDNDSILETENDKHVHRDGDVFIFDHSRYHLLSKTGQNKRITLILNLKRF